MRRDDMLIEIVHKLLFWVLMAGAVAAAIGLVMGFQ